MKQSLLLLFALCLATQALYAQQEYQHPSQACGIAYGYDSNGNRILRRINCITDMLGQRQAKANKPATALQVDSISLYPNPTHNALYISLANDTSTKQILIYNSIGKLISQQSCTCTLVQFNTIGLATGTYYAVIKRSSGIQTLPFVKIKEL